MNRILILTTLIAAVGLAHAQTNDITGDWQGTLAAGSANLRLVLHVTEAADGSLKANLDSVDQGANIPVNSITFKDFKLSLSLDSIHGAYEGNVSPDGNAISGTWMQGQPLPLDFRRASAKPAKPSDVDGTWMGLIDTGTIKLHVVFHILNSANGLTATMDSPDQGMKGLLASAVKRDGASLRIEADKLNGVYEGTIAADHSSIDGKWTQSGSTLPLDIETG